MPEFLELSTDIQGLIIAECGAADGPRKTLKNASLACRRMRQIAAPLLFRRIVVASDPPDMAHLEFLASNEQLRSYVREVIILITSGVFLEVWATELERLLPRLNNLQKVSIGGDTNRYVGPVPCEEDEDMVDIKRIQKLLPDDTYGGPMSPPITSAEPPLKEMRSASTEVGALIKSCQKLNRLCLELLGPNFEEHNQEKHYALENIIPPQSSLKELALYGEFLVSDKAWSHWALIPWAQLESLSMGNPVLINELAARLMDQPLPALRTLKLFEGDEIKERKTSVPEPSILPQFLCRLTVTHLSLTGQPPDLLFQYLGHENRNATNLRKLCFHKVDTGSQLSVPQVKKLGICPRLSWLGLDIGRHDLPRGPDIDRPLGYVEALAALRPLQHVRIFVPIDVDRTNRRRDSKRVLQECEAVTIFRSIQKRKQGCPVESMVICCGHEANHGLCAVWAWGEDRVVVDYRLVTRRLEIWDLNSMEKVEDCATHFKDWEPGESDATDDLLWGIPDVW
ncbi:hypothetical protein DL771_010115 [Monosporascus sp. 5C6A]|nr:hypothetical protein DL771_010115 [Monosporascus sp. 5C6A]